MTDDRGDGEGLPHDGDDSYLLDKQVGAPTTIGDHGHRLFLYPERRKGKRASRRSWLAALLIVIYFGVPWIELFGRPLLRVDVLNQTAYIFGLVLSMSEYNNVFFLFAALFLLLFLVTTLRGRIWCGYACPQTVFVEWVIRPIEELIEGPARKRRKLDQGPWTFEKIAKKLLKHSLFVLFSAVVANALLGYFIDPHLILSWVISPPARHPLAFGFVLAVIVLMYFDLGWFREQFCAFLCPYARFQSVMLDDSSPSVFYDQQRGEPRGKGAQKGDCIDCGLCVRVCPTGIDIRNGLQLECIQCERCIDACDSVMSHLKRPEGLVRIDSLDQVHNKSVPVWKRKRVLVYSASILLIVLAGALKIAVRDPITLTILRQPGAAYATMGDGRISNLFTVRGTSHTETPMPMLLELSQEETQDPQEFEIICPRCNLMIEPYKESLSPLIIVFDKSIKKDHVTLKVKGGKESHRLPLIK